MKKYEMFDGGATSDGVAEVGEVTSSAFSLEEQVRKTSETVERLAGLVATVLSAAYGVNGGGSDGGDA